MQLQSARGSHLRFGNWSVVLQCMYLLNEGEGPTDGAKGHDARIERQTFPRSARPNSVNKHLIICLLSVKHFKSLFQPEYNALACKRRARTRQLVKRFFGKNRFPFFFFFFFFNASEQELVIHREKRDSFWRLFYFQLKIAILMHALGKCKRAVKVHGRTAFYRAGSR